MTHTSLFSNASFDELLSNVNDIVVSVYVSTGHRQWATAVDTTTTLSDTHR